MNVSIIVPVYNVSAYIERCIKSVMCQSFTGSMECIIVDDCTPDDSIEKCETLISAYDGPITFLILHHEKNRGLSAARNTGTMAAKGEYIYYLDSDDELVPKSIDLLYAEVEKHPGVEMVQGAILAVPNQEYYDISFLDDTDFVDDNSWVRYNYYKLDQKLPTTAWNKLVLTSFIVENNLYFKEGLIHEDEMWMYLVVKKLSKYALTHKVTYIHYETPNSIMSAETKERTAKNWGIILSEVMDRLDSPFIKEQLLTYTERLVWAYGKHQDNSTYLPLKNRFVRKLACNHLFTLSVMVWMHFFLCTRFNNTFLYPRIIRKIHVLANSSNDKNR